MSWSGDGLNGRCCFYYTVGYTCSPFFQSHGSALICDFLSPFPTSLFLLYFLVFLSPSSLPVYDGSTLCISSWVLCLFCAVSEPRLTSITVCTSSLLKHFTVPFPVILFSLPFSPISLQHPRTTISRLIFASSFHISVSHVDYHSIWFSRLGLSARRPPFPSSRLLFCIPRITICKESTICVLPATVPHQAALRTQRIQVKGLSV